MLPCVSDLTSIALPRSYTGEHIMGIYVPPHLSKETRKIVSSILLPQINAFIPISERMAFKAEICCKRMVAKRFSSYLCSLISSVWQNRKSLVCKEDEKASGQKSQDVLQVENEDYLVAI